MTEQQILTALRQALAEEEKKAETENAMCGKHRYTAKVLKALLENKY